MDIFGRKRIEELEWKLNQAKDSKNNAEKCVREYRRAVETLNNDIKSLTDEINAKVGDCKVGAWCKDCKYCNTARLGNQAGIEEYATMCWIDWNDSYSKYYYCSKHLREICSEFEKGE